MNAIELPEGDFGISKEAIVQSHRDAIAETIWNYFGPRSCGFLGATGRPLDWAYSTNSNNEYWRDLCFRVADSVLARQHPRLATVILPSGYKDAAQFAIDCGVEIATHPHS